MPKETLNVGQIAQDVAEQVAETVANSVASTKTNQLLTAAASAETERVNAENARASAETARIAAEEARATEFAGFEEEIDSKLSKGDYDATTGTGYADNANNLIATKGLTLTDPFIFQETGGEQASAIDDGNVSVTLRGNTIAWNQLVKNGNFQDSSNWNKPSILTIENNIATITCDQDAYGQGIEQNTEHRVIKGHKYYFSARAKSNQIDGAVRATQYSFGPGVSTLNFGYLSVGTSFGQVYGFAEATENSSGLTQWRIACIRTNGTSKTGDVLEITSINIFDLTLMFGPGKEPTSVLEFTRLFPKPYYPFNAGEIRNAKTTGLKTVGYNALTTNRVKGTQSGFDASTNRTFSEGEYYVGLTANNYYGQGSVNSYSVSDNRVTCNVKGGGNGVSFPVRIVAGQSYTFEFSHTDSKEPSRRIGWYDAEGNFISYSTEEKSTAPSNAYWALIVLSPVTLNTDITFTDICFHLTHSGSRTGYAPHEEHVLHIDTSRYFPDGMNGIGGVYDELTPKRAIKRFAKLALLDLDWEYNEARGRFASSRLPQQTIGSTNGTYIANIRCSKYVAGSLNDVYNGVLGGGKDKCIALSTGTSNFYLYLNDSECKDVPTLEQKLIDVYLIYELAEPIVTSVDSFANVIPVQQGGTMEFIGTDVPQGNELFFQKNIKGFVEAFGEAIDWNPNRIERLGKLSFTPEYVNITLNPSPAGAYARAQVYNATFTIVISAALTGTASDSITFQDSEVDLTNFQTKPAEDIYDMDGKKASEEPTTADCNIASFVGRSKSGIVLWSLLHSGVNKVKIHIEGAVPLDADGNGKIDCRASLIL